MGSGCGALIDRVPRYNMDGRLLIDLNLRPSLLEHAVFDQDIAAISIGIPGVIIHIFIAV